MKQTLFLLLGFLIGILVFVGLRFYQTSQTRILHERFVVSSAAKGVRMVLLRQEIPRADSWFVLFIRDSDNARISQEQEQGKTFLAIPCGGKAYLAKFNPVQESFTVDGQTFPLTKGRIFLIGPQQVEQIETTPVFEKTLSPAITMKGGQKGNEALKSMVVEIREGQPRVEQFFKAAELETDGETTDAPAYSGPQF